MSDLTDVSAHGYVIPACAGVRRHLRRLRGLERPDHRGRVRGGRRRPGRIALVERRSPAPLFHLSLFASRGFTAAGLAATAVLFAIGGGAFMPSLFNGSMSACWESPPGWSVYAGDTSMMDATRRERLSAAALPIRLIWGDHDRIADPDYGRAYANAIPNAEFVLLTETGHMPQLVDDREVREVCREPAHSADERILGASPVGEGGSLP